MHKQDNTIAVNVVIDLTPNALQAIVENAKRVTWRNEKGHYKVDTADKVGEMISRFLIEKDFESYAQNPDSYNDESVFWTTKTQRTQRLASFRVSMIDIIWKPILLYILTLFDF